MYRFVVLSIMVFIAILHVNPSDGQASSDVLERINVDTYLRNKRLVEYHINCLVYSGPCDRIGNEIKRLFLTFRATGINSNQCGVCNPEQKQRLQKIAMHWQANYPVAWRDLQAAMQRAA